jgi:hypothetical protein
MSLVDLLEQLQSPCNLKTSWRRQVEGSAACFDGVSPNGIPASVLLANYIAELGSRAQQCLSAGAVGQQEDDVGADCLAVMQEVEGLLQLSSQPVLLQLLGGQGLQELVEGLSKCKQLLR